VQATATKQDPIICLDSKASKSSWQPKLDLSVPIRRKKSPIVVAKKKKYLYLKHEGSKEGLRNLYMPSLEIELS
jgi:hypothetical protein